MAVIIETSIGHLTVDLYTDERPRCSKNFLKLCKVKYYNFCLFHSVQHNLVAQTGDPTATGRGGMSMFGLVYGEQARYFEQEVKPRIKHTKRGQLSMVNNGDGKHGSQFFITLGQDLDYLDGQHTVFGEVAEGWEVLDKLNEAYCDSQHRPYRDIRIFHTVIIDDPFDDPEGLVIPDRSPEPSQEMLQSDRIGVDEEVDDTAGMTQEQVEELMAEKEARANAQLLEMVGDIPDAEVAPPDNVLFVCKLNPVTTSEDLSLIFSRFGPIQSCEVIKDHATGQSLQYAFIEFEDAQHCENAYFKMDNVLIDDRRIHVDFSQSVSKIRPDIKGKKGEEEKKDDQPRYVLKNQQRTDNSYDLVYEHDLPEASGDTKKTKKHKNGKHGSSDLEEDTRSRKKKKATEDHRSSSASPQQASGRDRRTSPPREGSKKERKRERRSPSSQEDRRKEKRKKDRSLSPETDPRKERKKKHRSPSPEKDRRKDRKKRERSLSPDRQTDRKKKDRSPSSEIDRKKERKKKDKSPSSEIDRKKERKRKDRSASPEIDSKKDRKKKDRSPSSEIDRKKDRKKKDRSPSSEIDRKKDRKRKDRSSSPEMDRRKDRKRERASSPEMERKKERKRKDRSPSPEIDRRKKRKDRSASAEDYRRKERRKEERSPSSELEDRRRRKTERPSSDDDEGERRKKKKKRRSSSPQGRKGGERRGRDRR